MSSRFRKCFNSQSALRTCGSFATPPTLWKTLVQRLLLAIGGEELFAILLDRLTDFQCNSIFLKLRRQWGKFWRNLARRHENLSILALVGYQLRREIVDGQFNFGPRDRDGSMLKNRLLGGLAQIGLAE